MKQIIKLKFSNGLEYDAFYHEVLSLLNLDNKFQFIEENEIPDVIIFGPYGNDLPPKGKYIRLGYFCENLIPDLTICEYAFGVPSNDVIDNPRYHTIYWHGFDPNTLVKPNSEDESDLSSYKKRKFCNFFYSNPVPFREKFFRELSKYKKVDAPGLSMKNMVLPEYNPNLTKWELKRRFLSQYKFTIAFESYSYPGYRTEKLTDPMLVESIPIYYGDNTVYQTFNEASFINCHQFDCKNRITLRNFLEQRCQMNFVDSRPSFHHRNSDRLRRKVKSLGRNWKMNMSMSKKMMISIIDNIVAIDENDKLYHKLISEPFLINNDFNKTLDSMRQFWIKIFNAALIK